MESKVNYAIVGLFVFLLSIVLIAVVLWLGTGGPREEHENFIVFMDESVSGLSIDSPVKFRGVDVGRITDINLDPQNVEQVELIVEIRKGTPITNDTRAQLKMQGLTGIGFLNLTGGTQDAPRLLAKPTPPYTQIESMPSLYARLDDTASELLNNLSDASERLRNLLNDENRDAFSETLVALQAFAKDATQRSKQLGGVLNDFSNTARSATKTSDQLADLLSQLDSTIKAFNTMSDSITAAGDSVKQSASTTREGVRQFSAQTLPELNNAVEEIGRAARSLRQFTEKLERDPSVIIYGTPRTQAGPGE